MEIITDNTTVFQDIINTRRSVRIFDQEENFDHDAVKRSLEMATLSPNSSNMQLWEFYRVIDQDKRDELSQYCLRQSAARTARELVVVVTRQDKWKERCEMNFEFIKKQIGDKKDPKSLRALDYYRKLMPMRYKEDPFRLLSLFKQVYTYFMGLKKPQMREVSYTDARICVHKSAALGAMTFMYHMTAEGYDTCPMEGFDSKRVAKMLNLPKGAEINMVIGCGKGAEGGIYSERHRVPYEEVIKTV
ncbi:nitroreductase family protein [Sediminitomix flava]|uniref:Nitroreductase n=1 Tax=Sediminitomix flava TaxID=379075 RepID=A0A315ZH92_SEDFL|nr:nitroreductase family protein [Sediminitomix flava]PWJ44975.1 nitroreductase [Sediminitomix flava]